MGVYYCCLKYFPILKFDFEFATSQLFEVGRLTQFIYLTHQETIEKTMAFCLLFWLALLFFMSVVLEKCAFDFSNPVPTAYYNFLEPFWI